LGKRRARPYGGIGGKRHWESVEAHQRWTYEELRLHIHLKKPGGQGWTKEVKVEKNKDLKKVENRYFAKHDLYHDGVIFPGQRKCLYKFYPSRKKRGQTGASSRKIRSGRMEQTCQHPPEFSTKGGENSG